MANKFYQQGRERAARVDELFSAIAPRYDLVNDLQSLGLHRLWKQRLMRLANAQPGSRVLDLCCGTGDVAGRFAERGARVVGLDFNEQMLAMAQKRAAAERNPVHYLRGDALHLPFGNGQFDVVTVSYGLRNLADIEGGVREMCRVAKPGGRLLVLDFGKPRRPLLRNSNVSRGVLSARDVRIRAWRSSRERIVSYNGSVAGGVDWCRIS